MTYLSPKRLESTEEDSEELLRQILKQLTIIVSQLQLMTDEPLDDSQENN